LILTKNWPSPVSGIGTSLMSTFFFFYLDISTIPWAWFACQFRTMSHCAAFIVDLVLDIIAES
jgi:hypothetical protein